MNPVIYFSLGVAAMAVALACLALMLDANLASQIHNLQGLAGR